MSAEKRRMFMTKQTKQVLAALLAALTLVPLATACSDQGNNDGKNTSGPSEVSTNNNSAETTDAETKVTTDLPDITWEGQDFLVLGQDGGNYQQFSNFEIFSEGDSAEPLEAAVYKRNTTIEDRYDVHIKQNLVESSHDELKNTVLNHEDLYDLAFINQWYIGKSAMNGELYELNGVDYIDFSKPYWNEYVNENVSICDRLYFTTSDFSLRDKSRTYIMAYNPDVAEAHHLDNPIDHVRAGTWTIDVMTSMVKEAHGDLNGDQLMTIDDEYGLVMDSMNAFPAFLLGCNNMLISKDNDDYLVVTADTDKMDRCIDLVIDLTCNPDYAFAGQFFGSWSDCATVFSAGRALFITYFTHSLKSSAATCDFEFCVTPFPKYDEKQEKHYTMADIYAMMFGIPSTSLTPEFSGFMLEALSCESTDTTLQMYYETMCKTRYSYNPNSAEMLDLIFEGIRYEPSMIYAINNLYNLFIEDLPNAGQNNFQSLYASKSRSIGKQIENVISRIEKLDF